MSSVLQIVDRLASSCLDTLAPKSEREKSAAVLVRVLMPVAVELDRHGSEDLARRVLRELAEIGDVDESAATATEALKKVWSARKSMDFEAWIEKLAHLALTLASSYAVYAAQAAAFAALQAPEPVRAPA